MSELANITSSLASDHQSEASDVQIELQRTPSVVHELRSSMRYSKIPAARKQFCANCNALATKGCITCGALCQKCETSIHSHAVFRNHVIFNVDVVEVDDSKAVDHDEFYRASSSKVALSSKLNSKVMDTLITARKCLGGHFGGLEIRFSDIVYESLVPVTETAANTVGDSALRSLFCLCSKPVPVAPQVILKNVSGILKPGVMTLVLGPPGSGKTALMKVLAGRINGDDKITRGEVLYCGEPAGNNVFPKKLAGFVDAADIHNAQMTVRETIDFALECTKLYSGVPEDSLPENVKNLKEQLKMTKTDFILELLGMKRCENTIIGDDLLRGVSGGEKKRVTLGEMFITPRQAYFLDEISTGLDSQTTLDIIRDLKAFTEIAETNMVISLLQPAPEVFDLFDDVILMGEGQIIYHGPAKEIMKYFYNYGFRLPENADKTDFLQKVSMEEEYDHYLPADFPKAERDKLPKSVDEWANRFKSSSYFQATKELLNKDTEYKRDWSKAAAGVEEYFTQEDPADCCHNTGIVTRRALQLCSRNIEYLRTRVMQNVFMGLLIGLSFYQLPLDYTNQASMGMRMSLLSFVPMFLSMAGMSQKDVVLKQRPIYYKQNDAGFFRTSSFVFSQFLSNFLVNIVECLILCNITYWMAGLTPTASAFFYFFFICLLLCQCIAAWIRFMANASPDAQIANGIVGAVIIVFIVFNGFLVTYNNIPDALKFCYWLSPLQWGVSALTINEFRENPYFNQLIKPTETLGTTVLNLYGIPTDNNYRGYAVIFLVGSIVLFNVLSGLALHYLRYDQRAMSKGKTYVKKYGELVKKPVQKLREADDNGSGDNNNATLSITPITLSFKDLTYTVQLPAKDDLPARSVDLLVNISGIARPGEMVALMGSSGAGKSTLLDVLAGRKTGGTISGDIRVNGYPLDRLAFSRVVGYVEQTDCHMATATVREALQFSADLRLPEETTQAVRDKYVEDILVLLELDKIADKQIGDVNRGGCSLEQRKRITIGVELVANPSVIFLDEPTSGLDSRAAEIVIQVIKKIALTGRTVIVTVHQPSYELFAVFDRLLLLKRGGFVVYHGDLGPQSSSLINYFHSIPGVKKIRRGANPADYMLDVLGSGTANPVAPVQFSGVPSASVDNVDNDDSKMIVIDTPIEATPKQVLDFPSIYLSSKLCFENERELQRCAAPAANQTQVSFGGQEYASYFPRQLATVYNRALTNYWRSPDYNWFRIAFVTISAVFFGCIYYKLQPKDDSSIRSLIAVLYFTNNFIGMVTMNGVMVLAVQERNLFYRERAGKFYNVGAYAISMGLVEIPYLAITSGVFASILWFMVGFSNDVSTFFLHFFIFFIYLCLNCFLGQFLSAFTPSVEAGMLFGSAISSLWNLFSGFMIPQPNIPSFLIWLFWANPARYALEAVVVNAFYCAGASCPTAVVGVKGAKVYVYPYIKTTYGMSYDNLWMDIGIIIAFAVVFRIFYVLSLKYKSFLTR
jgi:ABC-type multidrug transport system ATPase subunit